MISLLRLSGVGCLAILLFAALGQGCSRCDATGRLPVEILDVVDEASSSAKKIRFDTERARRYLEKALATSKAFRVGSAQEAGAYRARLRIVLASERQAGGEKAVGVYRAVQVELQLRQRRDEGGDSLLATGKQFLVQDPERNERDDGFDAVLEMVVQRAVDVADLQMSLRAMDEDDLRRALTDTQVEKRLYALRILRDRRARELVPDLINRLDDVDQEVVIEAVGALVAQQDRRAVAPLIRSTSGRDPVFLLQIITALGELGGVDAKGFLFALAAGHELETVRERAHEVFIELEATDPRPGPVGNVVALPEPVRSDGRGK